MNDFDDENQKGNKILTKSLFDRALNQKISFELASKQIALANETYQKLVDNALFNKSENMN